MNPTRLVYMPPPPQTPPWSPGQGDRLTIALFTSLMVFTELGASHSSLRAFVIPVASAQTPHGQTPHFLHSLKYHILRESPLATLPKISSNLYPTSFFSLEMIDPHRGEFPGLSFGLTYPRFGSGEVGNPEIPIGYRQKKS